MNFERTGDIKKSLGIGKQVLIRKKFVEDLGDLAKYISYGPNDEIIFKNHLHIRSSKEFELPDNLIIHGSLNLSNSLIKRLPENLTIKGHLYLNFTPIIDVPNNLYVNFFIYVNENQKRLIKFFKFSNNKFENKLTIERL